MDIDAYIASGILENYCLGFYSAEENAVIEANAITYPAIRREIEKIRGTLEDYFMRHEIKPSPSVKISLMRTIYEQTAAKDDSYPPLIDATKKPLELAGWIATKNITAPVTDFENLYEIDLPSTEQVINFFVHARFGHEDEIHDNFVEFLYVIKGACEMDFEGEKKTYGEGDIIQIMPHVRHYATVISKEPMIALVQRQACA